MYSSFYTAALGAAGQQSRLDVVANNLANVNTAGYKPKNAVFSDLLYYNMNNYHGEETEIKAGTGICMEKTDTNFAPSGFDVTGGIYDYAIVGDGFFMLRNPETNEITYTRNGHFSLSRRGDEFYLINDNGNLVLDKNRNAIRVTVEDGMLSEVAVYTFRVKNGMQSVGGNEYKPVEKNGAPILSEEDPRQGVLESSGVDMAREMTRVIETQRAYSYALKMVQTSDEVVNTINTLR